MDRKGINHQWAQVTRTDWGDSIAGFIFAGLDIAKIIPRVDGDAAIKIIASQLDAFVASHGAMPMCDDQEGQNRADDAWSKEMAPFVVAALAKQGLISENNIPWATSIAAEEIFVWITMEARPPAFYSGLAAKR